MSLKVGHTPFRTPKTFQFKARALQIGVGEENESYRPQLYRLSAMCQLRMDLHVTSGSPDGKHLPPSQNGMVLRRNDGPRSRPKGR